MEFPYEKDNKERIPLEHYLEEYRKADPPSHEFFGADGYGCSEIYGPCHTAGRLSLVEREEPSEYR